jgi:outer membrane protein assembly factor BamA
VTRVVVYLAAALLLTRPAAAFQPQDAPVLTDIRISGATVFTPDELRERHGLAAGEPLKEPPDTIAAEIEKRYARQGYTFAEVQARLDGTTLVVDIDEGQFDDIRIDGVRPEVADRLRAELALQPGDIFNRQQAVRALDHALEVAQGAIVRSGARDTFALEREAGRRVLRIVLSTRSNRSGVFLGTQGREDWYSPVDGFAPAFGIQSTIFDPERFNHVYWAGYVSYKFAPERVGYSFGFERPFLADGVLQLGASIHDLTASDDQWRLTDAEQSLVSLGFRNTFRDYYRRKGYQVHAAVRPLANHEWLVAWRSDEHLALANETDYGFFRGDHSFRPNLATGEGDLGSVLLGWTFDTRGLTADTPGERFRRHLRDDLFGSRAGDAHGARIEWTSEVAAGAFDHDFDFTRHVLNARAWLETSPSRLWTGRAIVGTASGTLPPQRVFALGGIGSVHGYRFKETAGERMLLLNGEFRQRFFRKSGLGGIAFIDAGRVFDPVDGSSGDWLAGAGVGLMFGSARLEFGWRLDDVPDSLQILFRLGPTW